MLRDAEDKLGHLEAFEKSEAWKLQRAVLESRDKTLAAQLRGLMRRVGRPAMPGEASPVTLTDFARLAGQIEENERLLRFTKITRGMWTDQLAQMRAQMVRQRAEA